MTETTRRFFLAGAAHVDRRGRPSGPFRRAASNPGTIVESVGGSILNAAMALRAFGAEVTLLSARGGDLDGVAVEKALREAQVLDMSATWLDRRSASYTAIMDDRGELVAGIADMDLYDLLSPRALARRHVREAMAACDALILDANLPPAGLAHMIAGVGERPVSAIGVSPVKAVKLAPHLRALSIVFLSRAEAAGIVEASAATGITMLARLLAEAGASRAVITDGPSDVAILEESEIVLQAPPPVTRLRDVTGAGDTLAAVASLAYVDGVPLVGCVRLGMAAASRRIAIGNPEPAATDREVVAAIRAVAEEMAPPRAVGRA